MVRPVGKVNGFAQRASTLLYKPTTYSSLRRCSSLPSYTLSLCIATASPSRLHSSAFFARGQETVTGPRLRNSAPISGTKVLRSSITHQFVLLLLLFLPLLPFCCRRQFSMLVLMHSFQWHNCLLCYEGNFTSELRMGTCPSPRIQHC